MVCDMRTSTPIRSLHININKNCDVFKKGKGVSHFPSKENNEIIDPSDAWEYLIFILDDIS